MRKPLRRFVALLLMAWLPFFSASALGMVTCPHTVEHDADSMAMEANPHTDHAHQPASHDPVQTYDCNQCGTCHICCSPGLISALSDFTLPAARIDSIPPDTHFLSITLPVSDPPPRARA